MARKGKVPIEIPNGVQVKLEGEQLFVKGPKGHLQKEIAKGIQLTIENNQLFVSVENEEMKALHGLYHALISNMVIGTTKGFEKRLEMIGVGYRAAVQGKELNLQVGFSHPTLLPIMEGLEVKVDKNTTIIINGIDKQKVGQFAATVRGIKPPEPYQGKGIRYSGEYVRKKAGKTAAKK